MVIRFSIILTFILINVSFTQITNKENIKFTVPLKNGKGKYIIKFAKSYSKDTMGQILSEVFELYSEARVEREFQDYYFHFDYFIQGKSALSSASFYHTSFNIDTSGKYLCISSRILVPSRGLGNYRPTKRMSKRIARMIISFLDDGRIVKVKKKFIRENLENRKN